MPSLRAAIDAKCKSCIYDPGTGNGTWREQVTACTSTNCPLHSVRPQIAAKTSRTAPKQALEVCRYQPVNETSKVGPGFGQIGSAAR